MSPQKIQDWPQRVERCGHEVAAWTEMRNEAIRMARKEGLSLREIAKLAGLSHGAIAKILAK